MTAGRTDVGSDVRLRVSTKDLEEHRGHDAARNGKADRFGISGA